LKRREVLVAAGASALLVAFDSNAIAQVAGIAGTDDVVVVKDGRAVASIVLSASAGEMEAIAATELVKYIERMTGARPTVLALAAGTPLPDGPALVIGQAALSADRSLQPALDRAAKTRRKGKSDAIALRRVGQRVYLAGSNDRAHYLAAIKLLQEWGCRWYMPTDFGEVVPEHDSLAVGALDHVHGSPFEIRSYWLSWLGDDSGKLDFQRHNFASASDLPVFGHALGSYTKKMVPPGQSIFNVPLSEDATAVEVASQIEAQYAKGVPAISLAIEDGIYTSESQSDADMQAGIYDKYMLAPSNTDAMLTLYNNVARILRAKYPASPTLLGGLAYANVTIPPQRVLRTEPNVVMWLAPIDIDPNHGMDDTSFAPRQEYKAMMVRWSQVLEGRLAIYDYDQGMLVWRDLPNPSHHVFAQDVKHYRDAGILGISTESRGATATTFLNLYFRLQLMWNPEADVDAMLAEFYPKFYGPAAAPMAIYWNAIFDAWKNTVATEHEYMVAPVIYTPELIETLRNRLDEAQRATTALRQKADPTRNEKLYLQRMQFTALSFAVIDNYMAMVRAGAGEADYKAATTSGERALAAREQLTAMSPTFTTYKKIGETGPAWMPGEVQTMKDLASLTDGSKGRLIAKMPLEWDFRTDPHDTGLARGWAFTSAAVAGGRDKKLRTDTYMQGQGIRHDEGQSFTGHYWYQTTIELLAAKMDRAHLMFPGLFNECWLYVNGELVAHRPFLERWWNTDYKFKWDVDLSGKLKPSNNLISLRGWNPHHFGGMFRRPFLYQLKVT
jgi:hypothetical protein